MRENGTGDQGVPWNLIKRHSEACLVGNPIADQKRPLEALRTVHSFDPCLACAIHAFDPEGNELGVVTSKV